MRLFKESAHQVDADFWILIVLLKFLNYFDDIKTLKNMLKNCVELVMVVKVKSVEIN